MSFLHKSPPLLHYMISLIRSVIIDFRYNDWTIADYFRKQGAQIGNNCRIDIRSEFGDEPYLISIGNHVHICRGVILHTNDGGRWIFSEEIPDINVWGKIVIEDNCLIGLNTQLLPNIRIGKNSIVGAGSVVISGSNIPPNSIVIGIPARVIGSTVKYKEKCLAAWKEQRPPAEYVKNLKERKQKRKEHLTKLFP